MNSTVTVRVPATTANLGPGFDCLGLALDLWNETTFTPAGEGIRVEVSGLGAESLPTDERNLIAQVALGFCRSQNLPPFRGLVIRCQNRIPPSSGLGSSAAAILTGLLGANALVGSPASDAQLLRMATAEEGHPDNVTAALFGGLVIAVGGKTTDLLTSRLETPPMRAALAIPRFDLATSAARAALPAQVSRADAIFNLGRTALVVEALRRGDLDLLGRAMEDRLHQPYRFALIPGAAAAVAAARKTGAAAVALSGAGPSLIAFAPAGHAAIADAMAQAFQSAGIPAEGKTLAVSPYGATITED